MTTSASVLFKLLRIALGNSTDSSLPSFIDWREVIDLSFDQGVAAIAVDGLQKSIELSAESLELSLDAPELEDLKYEWFGSCFLAENDYSKHIGVFRKLTELFNAEGVGKILLIKGLTLAPYYPIPSHRPCGDIDIHLFDDFELGNKIIESRGITIDRHNKKHSTFYFNEILVENHKSFLDLNATRAERKSDKIISSMVEECTWSDELNCYTFSPVANYLFLLRHMTKHFSQSISAISVRHLLDWGLFLNAVKDKIEIDKANELVAEMGLTKVKEIFTRLSIYVTGCDLKFALDNKYASDSVSKIEERFLEEILAPQPVLPSGVLRRSVAVVKIWFGQMWKFKSIPDSFTTSFIQRFVRLSIYKVSTFVKGGKLVKA